MPGARPGGINWAVWLWAGMVLMTLFQVGAMFGGVAHTLGLLAFSLALLLGGGNGRIEKITTVKVGLFRCLLCYVP